MKAVLFAVIFLFLMTAFEKNSLAGPKEDLRILAIGDSTTAGTPGFFSPSEDPPHGSGNEKSQYAYWILQKHPGWTVWNTGVRGQRSDQILKRFKREFAVHDPDVVVVLAGVNDLYQGYPIDRIQPHLRGLYDLGLAKKARVMACSILPYNVSTEKVKQDMALLNDWIESYAKEHGFLFCDTYAVLNDPKNPGNLMGTPDDIHPDVEGYRKMGEAIAKTLEALSF